jgi:shikimate dehydrogenase
MHNFWMKELGIDGNYEAHEVAPEELGAKIKSLQSEGYLGGNVTIPHKKAVMGLCDADEFAHEVGAANTLVFEGSKIKGYNTDVVGFNQGLVGAGVAGSIKKALVIGAGGAARAAIVALVKGKSKIKIANRTKEHAENLAAEFGCEAIEWSEIEKNLEGIDLLVNTTSLGMVGNEPLNLNLEKLKSSAIVYDMVYRPLETKLLSSAKALDLNTMGGLKMLIFQGLHAFWKWFPEQEKYMIENLHEFYYKTEGLLIKSL